MLDSLASGLDALTSAASASLVQGSLLPDWLNPNVFLQNSPLGPAIVFVVVAIIFAETGLLVGFFLPGDSMLFTAGMLMATGAIQFPLWLAVLLFVVAAIIGNQCGYLIGRKAGPAIFNRPDSKLFKAEHVDKAQAFFEKHGGKALILARFVPIVRTFVPVISGVARMDARRFFVYNVIGGVAWAGLVTLLGVWLGQIPWVGKNIDLIFIAIVLISVVPIGLELLKARRASKQDSKPTA